MQLTVESLVVNRGSRTIIGNVSFSLTSGETLLLTGANGTGKTTLIRAIAGLLPPLSGLVRLDGGNAELPVGEQCHYAGHLNAIKAALSVRENVSFWAHFLGDETGGEATIDAALDRLNLDVLSDVPAGYLSAGQKRRLGLARLLVASRPVWLLDEPTVSLDTASVAVMTQIINEHSDAGGITIAATHLPLGLTATRELRLGVLAEAS